MLFYISPSGTSCHLPHQREALAGGFQHIFNEYTISGLWIVDQDMGNSTHQLAVLNNRTAAHE